LKRLRSRSRRREVPLHNETQDPGVGDRETEAGRLILDEALAALPDDLRVVFVLREIEGYSHAEIAEMLGIRRGTSEVRLFRAIRHLRRLLRTAE
jgi:RNA polymerase sigma-70 factor, ECF subfamily